jgi:hypothetical protein
MTHHLSVLKGVKKFAYTFSLMLSIPDSGPGRVSPMPD